MAAWHSLGPEDRADIEREFRKTIEDRARYEHNLARLELQHAPRSFRGKLRYQIRQCRRHEARFQRMLEEVAA